MSVLQGTPEARTFTAPNGTDLTGCTVTCTVTAPDGTTATAVPVISGPTATVQVQGMQVGSYMLVWACTGAQTGGAVDQFTVIPARLELVSLSDLKDGLNLRPDDTVKDAKLRRWLTAAGDVIENVTGTIRLTNRTDIFDGGTPTIVLTARWANTITSITESTGSTTWPLTLQPLGQSVDGYGYTWDPATNEIVRRSYGGSVITFAPGRKNITATYRAGLATVPGDIQEATIKLIGHWYRKDAVPVRGTPFAGQQADDAVPGPGNYMLPNEVMEILEPWRRPPQVG